MTRSRNALIVAVLGAVMLAPVSSLMAGGRGGGGRGGGGRGGGQQQPQQPQENPTITADRQQVATATTQLNTANVALNDAVRKFTEEFMKQPENGDLQKAVDEANKAVDAARAAVIEKLKKDSPEYKAATQKEKAAQDKLRQLNAGSPTSDQRQAQAKIIFEAGDAVVKIENEALAKDAAYQEAKQKLATAVAAINAAKEKLAEAAKADTNLVALKQTRDAAQTTLDEARKKLSTDMATMR